LSAAAIMSARRCRSTSAVMAGWEYIGSSSGPPGLAGTDLMLRLSRAVPDREDDVSTDIRATYPSPHRPESGARPVPYLIRPLVEQVQPVSRGRRLAAR
jgi:hypothetical protein